MAWGEADWDMLLVPLGLAALAVYHAYFLHRLRTRPRETVMGLKHAGQRAWVHAIMKDNDKKNVLAVQTLRNSMMASILMASVAVILCSGVTAFISSSYNIKKPLENYVLGAHNSFALSAKVVSLLLCFLFSFFCHMQSVRFLNHVNYLINTPCEGILSRIITPDYVANVLAKGVNLHAIGSRSFYFAFPLLLWIFGPIPVAMACFALVPFLYHLDMTADPSIESKTLSFLEE